MLDVERGIEPGGEEPDGGFGENVALPPLPGDLGRFELGRVGATSQLVELIGYPEVFRLIGRHEVGDWGDLDSEDKGANETALRDGARLLSCYHVGGLGEPAMKLRVYVITEWDRSATTALLAEEY